MPSTRPSGSSKRVLSPRLLLLLAVCGVSCRLAEVSFREDEYQKQKELLGGGQGFYDTTTAALALGDFRVRTSAPTNAYRHPWLDTDAYMHSHTNADVYVGTPYTGTLTYLYLDICTDVYADM